MIFHRSHPQQLSGNNTKQTARFASIGLFAFNRLINAYGLGNVINTSKLPSSFFGDISVRNRMIGFSLTKFFKRKHYIKVFKNKSSLESPSELFCFIVKNKMFTSITLQYFLR